MILDETHTLCAGPGGSTAADGLDPDVLVVGKAIAGGVPAAADDFALQTFLHLHALNRDLLLTPFHNMALMCPATTAEDVDRHTDAFTAALADLC